MAWDQPSLGPFLPALLWGVAFANIVRGVPIGAKFDIYGWVLQPAQPVRAGRGLTTLPLFIPHGAIFLALKTDGDIRGAGDKGGQIGAGRER